MDTSKLAFPKGRPAALERADRRKARKTVDEKESDKVKVRSGKQCEITHTEQWGNLGTATLRCNRRAMHVHHLMGGIGVRGRGESAKAENKVHVCADCHRDIHAHVLVPDGKHWKRLK